MQGDDPPRSSTELDDMPLELREDYLKSALQADELSVFPLKKRERVLDFKSWTPEEIKSIDATILSLSGS